MPAISPGLRGCARRSYRSLSTTGSNGPIPRSCDDTFAHGPPRAGPRYSNNCSILPMNACRNESRALLARPKSYTTSVVSGVPHARRFDGTARQSLRKLRYSHRFIRAALRGGYAGCAQTTSSSLGHKHVRVRTALDRFHVAPLRWCRNSECKSIRRHSFESDERTGED
jgi:hypothetical protein